MAGGGGRAPNQEQNFQRTENINKRGSLRPTCQGTGQRSALTMLTNQVYRHNIRIQPRAILAPKIHHIWDQSWRMCRYRPKNLQSVSEITRIPPRASSSQPLARVFAAQPRSTENTKEKKSNQPTNGINHRQTKQSPDRLGTEPPPACIESATPRLNHSTVHPQTGRPVLCRLQL